MTLSTFLVGLVGPLMARWLASLGLSLVTLAGLTAATTTLKGYITSNIGGLPAKALQLGGLFGVWECIGLVLGAIAFVITWRTTTGFWALAKS